MNERVRIRKMNKGEEQPVSSLVMESFFEFVAPDYEDEGIETFTEFASPENLGARNASGHSTLIAEFDGELGGMVQIRYPNHILMLFVKKRFQRRGVAQTLLESALAELTQLDKGLEHVTVNSSLFAVGIYEKLGFEVRGPEEEKDGMRTVPMLYRVRESV